MSTKEQARVSSNRMMTLDQYKDKHLGLPGSTTRDQYEFDLKVKVMGDMIKAVRKERGLTQQELGDLIGVQKAQICRLERNTKNITVGTILKVFQALQAQIRFTVQLQS